MKKYVWVALFFISCGHKDTLFTLLDESSTNVSFVNHVQDTDTLSILDYLYFYNGGGVAIGDINNDGLPDIYFSSNMGSNKLYLNKGNLSFEDITDKAGVAGAGNWKTGVTIVDVNGDGWQDIYVCEVGRYKNLHGKNELFINNRNGSFTESAHEYDLDIEGFNTQAVFFDYDHDGDVDMFLVNHSVHSTDTYVKSDARNVFNDVSGDKLFRNDFNHFTDVTAQAHIYSSIIGYGLNAIASDLNNDGWEDIYVSNDFHENDYYYLNQKDGTFKEIDTAAFGHESRFSMGSDIADMNNDGWLDIITLDMLAPNDSLVKSSTGDDPQEIYQFKLSYGYHYQYSRNCLQLNTGGGLHFSDIGLYAGIAATDWSWSPLAADFDNDGIKDLFVTNGIVRRPNDLDYLKYVSANYYNEGRPNVSKLEALSKMPDGKQHNFMFRGTDSLRFQDKSMEWGFENLSYSNGAAYADLDNDGDLDIVVNNINESAFIYRNNTVDKKLNHYIAVDVKGYDRNQLALGAKVVIRQGGIMQVNYINTSKGFESSGLQSMHFGLGSATMVDTLQVIWPDGMIKELFHVKADQKIVVNHPDAFGGGTSLLPSRQDANMLFADITDSIDLSFRHRENEFNDFGLQPLMTHGMSTAGPKLAVADVNGDGLDDFFVCGAKGQPGALFVQSASGKFVSKSVATFEQDSLCEEVNALFFDADGDKDPDLYVVSAGDDKKDFVFVLLDRLYINDGKGNFRGAKEFGNIALNKSALAAADFDKDGDIDLFIGNPAIRLELGLRSLFFLLLNDGHGNFYDSPDLHQTESESRGLITDAVCTDIDHDGWPDLVLAGDWMPITVLKNEKGKLKNITSSLGLQSTTGLWTRLMATDINGDGYEDLLAGNFGENSKLRASAQFPLKIFVDDFDNNGDLDPVLAVAENGKYFPFLGKEELEKRLPSLIRKKYTDYTSFAGQTVQQILGDKLSKAKEYNATMLSSVLLTNNQKGGFTISKLPYESQWSSINTFIADDLNGDGKKDILSGGNFFNTLPYEGRYDAGALNVLFQQSNGSLQWLPPVRYGISISGEVRDIKPIQLAGHATGYLFALNNDKILIATLKKH